MRLKRLLRGYFFESEDETLLTDATKTDPLSEARQGNIFDPTVDTMSCFDEGEWTDRYMTEGGLSIGDRHITDGTYQSEASSKKLVPHGIYTRAGVQRV